jgi:phenylalanyl-tRNA synthetase alpha subunit
MPLKKKIKALSILLILGFISLIIYKTQKSSHGKTTVIVQFIEDINPELKNKIDQIDAEITVAKQKVAQINHLEILYPHHKNITQKALKKWKELHTKLKKTKKEIHQKAEKSYIIYKINQIEGNKDFQTQSKELLLQANQALKDAKKTQVDIEKSLYKREKSMQTKSK